VCLTLLNIDLLITFPNQHLFKLKPSAHLHIRISAHHFASSNFQINTFSNSQLSPPSLSLPHHQNNSAPYYKSPDPYPQPSVMIHVPAYQNPNQTSARRSA